MISPALAHKFKPGDLRRREELALAEYRHVCDYERKMSDDEIEFYHQKACEAVAMRRSFDLCREISHHVSTDQFHTLAERAAREPGLRQEIHFNRS